MTGPSWSSATSGLRHDDGPPSELPGLTPTDGLRSFEGAASLTPGPLRPWRAAYSMRSTPCLPLLRDCCSLSALTGPPRRAKRRERCCPPAPEADSGGSSERCPASLKRRGIAGQSQSVELAYFAYFLVRAEPRTTMLPGAGGPVEPSGATAAGAVDA